MKYGLVGAVILFAASLIPSIAMAKGVPLFFQTGDELFEIEGSPGLGDGYSIGYACKRFGIFGADVWTWDCDLMAVNLEEFSVGELDTELKNEYSAKYSLTDRKRDPWNHYGVFAFGALVFAGAIKKRKKS